MLLLLDDSDVTSVYICQVPAGTRGCTTCTGVLTMLQGLFRRGRETKTGKRREGIACNVIARSDR